MRSSITKHKGCKLYIKLMEAKVAKNTKGAKAFLLTCNEESHFADVIAYVRSLSPNYMVASKEIAPTTGHVHMHLYAQFVNTRRLSLKKLCGSRADACRGSCQQNMAYVKKDGDIIVEEGTPRFKGGATIKDVKAMSKEQRAELPVQMYNIVQKVNEDEAKDISPMDYYKKVDVFYVYGDSGAGKTKWCIDNMVENKVATFNEVKYDGSFWHGVKENGKVALYDDWRDSHMKPAEFINFIDYNRHVMNVKGGSVRNGYERIYITSVQSPDEIYKSVNGEPRKQWERRMKCIHINSLE